jgi:hypothetical protein
MSRFPYVLDNQFTDGDEDVSLMCRPPFTPGRFLVLIYVRGLVDPRAIAQLEGLGQLKNPITSGSEPTTFQLVAYLAYRPVARQQPWNKKIFDSHY